MEEDEEWNFLANMKSLKSKVANKDKFKHQSKIGEEAKQAAEDESEETDGLDSDDEFFVEPPEVGDQFMACKPWIGAIKQPDVVPHIDPSKPEE